MTWAATAAIASAVVIAAAVIAPFPDTGAAQPSTPRQESAFKPKDSFKDCAECPEMIVVPAGSFLMGSPSTEADRNTDEGPQHRVTFERPFAVAKFAVTAKEWQVCVQQRGCREDADDGWGELYPVTGPSWNDAQSFVTWLAKATGKPYRLLSEAEYEYAARAGGQSVYPWGDTLGAGNANCFACGSRWDNKQPAPVGSFAPNRFGLYDMVGNVQSFVEDCYHDSYQGAPTDGSAWTSGDCGHRVVRGGSFARNPVELRSAARQPHGTIDRYPDLGFRVARALDR